MSFIVQKLGKGFVKKRAAVLASGLDVRDPYQEEYVDEHGRTRMRRTEIPVGLSKRDQKILRRVQFRASKLDKGFSLCGFRFGYTAVLGLIPVIGDLLAALLNYFLVLRVARKAELPGWLQAKMLTNNAISAAVGLIPFLGDVILAVWKANSRNALLLEEYLRLRGEMMLSDPEHYAQLVWAEAEIQKLSRKERKALARDPAQVTRRGFQLEQEHIRELRPGAGCLPKDLPRLTSERATFSRPAPAQAPPNLL